MARLLCAALVLLCAGALSAEVHRLEGKSRPSRLRAQAEAGPADGVHLRVRC